MRITILASIVFVTILAACDNTDMYTFAKCGPEPERIYLFMHDGMVSGNMNGRHGADKLCREQYDNQYGDRDFFLVKAFLSVSSEDEIRDLICDEYQDAPVYGIHDISLTETLLASSWSELWDGDDINATLGSALNIGANWWSGSDSSGAFKESCQGWTSDDTIGIYGTAGVYNAYDVTWIDDMGTTNCPYSYNLICVAY